MKAIHAIWKDGRIVPTQPVDWPDGTPLTVEPAAPDDDLLGDDPASIARWLAWYDALDPLVFSEEEEAAWYAARREGRDRQKADFAERADRLKALFE